MKYLKYSIIIIGLLALVSCTDQWHEEQSRKLIVKYDWTLNMYVDGVQNELVSVGEMSYRFNEDGTLIKETQNEDLQTSTWDMPQRDYVRIGSATFRIRTLTNKIMSLEYGEDVMYFLPETND
jgi:hypothetical protein